MRRSFRFALGFVIILSVAAGTARAIDWGWGGWGGWVDTPEGALARGMGQYYEGLGVLNKKTAIGDSINVDTMMRWNVLFDAHLEATRRMVARRRQLRAGPGRSSRDPQGSSRESVGTRRRKRQRLNAIAHAAQRPADFDFGLGLATSRSMPAPSATFRFAMRPRR